MEKLNFQQILEIVKQKLDPDNDGSGVEEFAYEDYDHEELGLGEIEEVEQEGGMDEGSNWTSVKHFKDHDVYICVSGFYSSGNGTDFDGWFDCTEVRPTQKTITVYE